MSNPFFLNKGPISLNKVYEFLKITDQKKKNFNFYDIKDLYSADKTSITFFHSKKYKEIAKLTKAPFCLTTELLQDFLPKTCEPIIVNNVLTAVANITEKFINKKGIDVTRNDFLSNKDIVEPTAIGIKKNTRYIWKYYF